MSPPDSSRGLFRRQARARLEAAEKLDTLLAITSPRLWMVLVTAIALIAAALVWVFLGTAQITVPITGIYLPVHGVQEISATVPGVVTSLPYDVGVEVAAQESIATVTDPTGKQEDITTQVAGTIVAQYISVGTYVLPGQPVAELFPFGDVKAGIMFVSAQSGKAIAPGQEATISPSTAPSAQFGSIVGHVQSVSPLPLSTQKIQQLVGNRAGVVSTVQALGSALEVVVVLKADTATRSGFAWTSGSGPPFQITPGTLMTGQVILASTHPSSQAF